MKKDSSLGVSPRTPEFISASSVHMDALRSLAATAVLISHWRYLFFRDFPTLPHSSLAIKAAYLLSGLGHQAVMVFFVLSGYLVGSSALRSIRRGSWSWKHYLVNRMTRLWTVLVPALVVGFLLDYVGTHRFAASGVYSGIEKAMLPMPVASQMTARIFFGNLLFLQNILVGTFGSNGPLWSLANEFWYYICFPFLVLAIRPGVRLVNRVLNAVPAILIMACVGRSIRIGFLVWLMGAGLSLTFGLKDRLHVPQGFWRISAGIGAVFVLGLACIARVSFLNGNLADLLLGCGCAALLFCLLQSGGSIRERSFYALTSRHVAQGSYTLYLVHVPFLVLLQAALIHEQRLLPDGQHVLYAALVLGMTLMYAALMYGLFERHTAWVRALFFKVLSGKSPSRPVMPASKSEPVAAD